MTPVPRQSWHYNDLSPRNSQVNTQQRVAYRPSSMFPSSDQAYMLPSSDQAYAGEGQNQVSGYDHNNQNLDSDQDFATSNDGDQDVGLQENMSKFTG